MANPTQLYRSGLPESSAAETITKFIIAKGNIPFQATFINWSYLNLGTVHLIHINVKIKKQILAKKAKKPTAAAKL